MSEHDQHTETTVAAEAAPEPKSKALTLEDLVPGLDDQKMRVRVYPHANSTKEGYVLALFDPPSSSTVTTYDALLLGLKGRGKGDSWKAAESVLKKFEDLEDFELPEPLREKHGNWRTTLLKEPRLRPLAESIASAYVRDCRVQAESDND